MVAESIERWLEIAGGGFGCWGERKLLVVRGQPSAKEHLQLRDGIWSWSIQTPACEGTTMTWLDRDSYMEQLRPRKQYEENSPARGG